MLAARRDPQLILPTRQLFTSPGVPEDPTLATSREQRWKESFLKGGKAQNTEQFEGFLDTLDFNLLKKLFIEFASRHNLKESALNVLGRERIYSRENLMVGGQYYPDINVIFLDEPQPRNHIFARPEGVTRFNQQVVAGYGSWEIFRLASLVHEQAHAVSRNVCVGLYESRELGRESFRFQQSGFHQMYNTPLPDGYNRPAFYTIDASHFFHALNEGMVERVSRQMTLAYLAASGMAPEAAEIYSRNLANEPFRLKHYQAEIEVLEHLVQRVSTKTLPAAEIWAKLEKGLLYGERFEKCELSA